MAFATRNAAMTRLQIAQPALGELFEVLVRPIRDELIGSGAKTVVLSLDGALRYVPFAALWDESESRWFMQDYASTIYTEVARATLERNPPERWTAAGLGLQESREGHTPLPVVQSELDRIVRDGPEDPLGIVPGIVFLDNAFSRRSLREVLNTRYPIVHVASHFVFRPGTARDSYLLLGDGDHLTLEALRLENWSFDEVDLLTLSACDIGLGADSTGSEIEGLGALAQHRGARGVVATLWSVADESTAEFMEAFYETRMGKRGAVVSKAAALQTAQQRFVAPPHGGPPLRRHPFFWAGYVPIGNWR